MPDGSIFLFYYYESSFLLQFSSILRIAINALLIVQNNYYLYRNFIKNTWQVTITEK